MRRILLVLTFVLLLLSMWMALTVGQVQGPPANPDSVVRNIIYAHVPSSICSLLCFVVLLVVSIVGLWLVYRMVKKALEPKSVVDLTKDVAKAAEEGPEFHEWEEAEAVAERVRAQIRDMVQRNPRAVAGVLKRWMSKG